MTLKELMAQDLDTVIYDTDEHAETAELKEPDGTIHVDVRVIINRDMLQMDSSEYGRQEQHVAAIRMPVKDFAPMQRGVEVTVDAPDGNGTETWGIDGYQEEKGEWRCTAHRYTDKETSHSDHRTTT